MLERLEIKKAECEAEVAACELELERAKLKLELIQELIDEETEDTEETITQPC